MIESPGELPFPGPAISVIFVAFGVAGSTQRDKAGDIR